MNKKSVRVLSVVVFILFFLHIHAYQAPKGEVAPRGVIYGIVKNQQNKKTMQDVSVVVLQQGKIINGVLTNKKGYFKIQGLKVGEYQLKISFMGFKQVILDFAITSTNSSINFKTTFLESNVNELQAVEIRAEKSRITQEIDKKVIHVGRDLLAVGSTAIEILANLPSITVDGNNKISYRGNTNVMIYVDGKPTSIAAEDILNQIPANTIKKIELISNPSARYNPEGMNGIINIVLLKNSNLGFHGKLNTGVTFANKISSNSSLNMNFKKGKLNIFTNLGYIEKNKFRKGYFYHDFNQTRDDFTSENNKQSILIKLGFDFDITKKQVFSFYTYQNFLDTQNEKISIASNPIETVKFQTDNDFNNKVQIYNFNYSIDFNKEGEKIEFEANFDTNSIQQLNSRNNITNNTFEFEDDIAITRNYTIFNIDYQNSLQKKHKIELGVESRIHKADNKKQTTQIGLPSNSFFEYDREEYSLYGTFASKINDQFSYKLGSRLESYAYNMSLDKLEIYSKKYLSLYPSFSLVYQKNKKNRYQIGYSRHIFRPSINEINPTSVWSSSVMTFYGNPKLKPTFVDYYEFIFIHKFKKGTLRLNPFYQINRNTIYQSLHQDPNNPDKLILTYDNGGVNHRVSLEFSIYYKLLKWWSVSIGSYAETYSENGIVNNQNKTIYHNRINTTIYQSFNVSPKFKITLLGKYNGAKKTLQFNAKPSGKVDVATRYSLLKNKASLSLRFTDIFNTSDYTFYADGAFKQNGLMQLDAQSVYFGFNYDFGSKKIKNRRRKEHEGQEIDGGGIF